MIKLVGMINEVKWKGVDNKTGGYNKWGWIKSSRW